MHAVWNNTSHNPLRFKTTCVIVSQLFQLLKNGRLPAQEIHKIKCINTQTYNVVAYLHLLHKCVFFPSPSECVAIPASVLQVGTLHTVRLRCWIMESCRRSAHRQSRWHTDPGTYSATQLGQHRWVVGKQAAAGGRMDHKARALAKFHHLLWIAWEAFSTATGGTSESHAIANPQRALRCWRCTLSLPGFTEFNTLQQN